MPSSGPETTQEDLDENVNEYLTFLSGSEGIHYYY